MESGKGNSYTYIKQILKDCWYTDERDSSSKKVNYINTIKKAMMDPKAWTDKCMLICKESCPNTYRKLLSKLKPTAKSNNPICNKH